MPKACDVAKFLTINQVRERYGGVSRMWIHRRQRDAGFPAHATRFGGTHGPRSWLAADLDAWDAAQIGRTSG